MLIVSLRTKANMLKLSLLTAILAATTSAVEFHWTKCTNAPRCNSQAPPGDPTTYSAVTIGGIIYWPGGYIFPWEATTGFSYARSDGYWYSHDTRGLYVSPAGYVKFNHGYNVLGLKSKDRDLGVTYWKNFGAPCCLPDNVGTNIENVYGYKSDGF